MHAVQLQPVSEPAAPPLPAGAAPPALPELLAPAGDWECARAAVENGADTIYFGLERFNARMRAHNFTEADLPKLMEFLHRRGVKGYVTFNTLVFQNEMAEAEQQLRALARRPRGVLGRPRRVSADARQEGVPGTGADQVRLVRGCRRVVRADAPCRADHRDLAP